MKILICAQTLLLAVMFSGYRAHVVPGDDEQAIRTALATFYEGWNTHDADKMVSVFAEDIDHIDVFGEWHKGRAAMREDLALVHAGPLRNSQKKFVVEKNPISGSGRGCYSSLVPEHSSKSRDLRNAETEGGLADRQLYKH
jgi:ketosteroid isomerase-like protein